MTVAPDQYLERLPRVLGRYSPVIVDHGEGSYIWGHDGRRYLDFTTGIGVTNTGHCHPAVVKAIQDQAAKIIHAQANILIHEPMIELMDELTSTMPDKLNAVFFANSGAEAIEAAVKLAKIATGRPAIVAFRGAFHGRTHLAMSLTTSRVKVRGHYEPLLPSIYHTPFPYPFRNPYATDPSDACITELERLFETVVMPDDVAAIIVEPIQGEGGYIVPPDDFLGRVREICDRHGILLIADEIQTGVGRTGRWWAFEHSNFVPDIVAVAKGIASGMPMSAIVAPQEIMDAWAPGSHGGTYGGNAVTCAAGVATFRAIRDEGMIANAVTMGQRMMDGLDRIAERNPLIGDVRGKGLMVAAEFVTPSGKPNPGAVASVVARSIDDGVLLLTAGTWDQAIRIIPPLNVSADEIDEFLTVFEAAADAAR
ncbi:MAG TPA: aminotransferase class III-fold pyridoxal phosphate-dependent enzyme [Thermomicrobiales bacterium]|nr:aminotransferase class III-fold pyridoxal phosphate-dependent enzyme [Thermomicrobiales bacterium]HQZ88729.1 aminotransferase class III-fold pyridoxal phosphate-dependent enzyme [Thermomicrobiales bacterium]